MQRFSFFWEIFLIFGSNIKPLFPEGSSEYWEKLAEIRDAGIPIYFFVGNHDLWMRDYFKKELGIPVFFNPQEFNINGKSFL